MPMDDPVVGGIFLVRAAIRSPNYVEGVSGWTINIDGSAEFNNLTIRGTFTGDNFVINSAGAFFYDGVPALGDLLVSIAGAAGFDDYGNAYAEGLSVGVATPRVVIGPVAGEALIYFPTGALDENSAPAIQAFLQNSGQNSLLVVRGGTPSTELDYSALALTSSSEDGTTTQASGDLIYVDTGGTTHEVVTTGHAGAAIAGSVTAVVPGSGTSRANVFQTETWHTATLAAGFTTSVSDEPPRYRLEGTGGGVVRLDGTAYTSAATAAGAPVFTLPVGYRPTIRRRFVGTTNASGYTTVGGALWSIAPTGVVTLTPACSAASQQACLDGITFAID
jgi:hypothetical protein